MLQLQGSSLGSGSHLFSYHPIGGAPILSNLFFLLGEPGNACLIPAPYYAAFENDMNLLSGIVPVPVLQQNPVAGPVNAELERAYRQAKKASRSSWRLCTDPALEPSNPRSHTR